MVAENRKRLGRQRARRNVEDRGGQLAGDLVHIGDHQQQALRGGEGGSERAGLQCAVQRARRAAFALHLDHRGHRAPDVRFQLGGPLVGPFAHGRRGRNRVNGDDFVDLVGHIGRGFIAVDGDFRACDAGWTGQNFPLLLGLRMIVA